MRNVGLEEAQDRKCGCAWVMVWDEDMLKLWVLLLSNPVEAHLHLRGEIH